MLNRHNTDLEISIFEIATDPAKVSELVAPVQLSGSGHSGDLFCGIFGVVLKLNLIFFASRCDVIFCERK